MIHEVSEDAGPTFEIGNLQQEIEQLEQYNRTHDVPRLMLPEGEESGI